MPEHIIIYNGSGTPCDMIEGTCACGAWHNVNEWKGDKRDGRSWVVDYIKTTLITPKRSEETLTKDFNALAERALKEYKDHPQKFLDNGDLLDDIARRIFKDEPGMEFKVIHAIGVDPMIIFTKYTPKEFRQ